MPPGGRTRLNGKFVALQSRKVTMKISTKLSSEERHYLANLINSGTAEIPDSEGKVSKKASYKLVVEQGFIVGAVKIIRKQPA